MIALLLPLLWVLIPLALGLLAFVANLWFGLTDWKTALIFVGALVACGLIAQTNSPWTRLAITAVLCVACFFKGTVDGTARTNAKWQALQDAELSRQKQVDDDAQVDGLKRVDELEQRNQKLTGEEKKINDEALQDKNAARDSLSVDSVLRLNRMRADGLRHR